MSERWRTTVWTARLDEDRQDPNGARWWIVVNEDGELVADMMCEENARLVALTPSLLRKLRKLELALDGVSS